MRTIHPIRHCRLWLLAIVVIVLAAISSAPGQVRVNEIREPSILLSSLLDSGGVTERGPAHAR